LVVVRKYSFFFEIEGFCRQDEMYNESVSVFNCASLTVVELQKNNCG